MDPSMTWFDNVDQRPAPRPGLNWLTTMLYVTDVRRATEVYAGVLGLVTIFELPGEDGSLDFARMRYRGNNITIGREGMFDYDGKAPVTSGTRAGSMFYVYVDDPVAVCTAAAAFGCTILEEPFPQFWGDLKGRFADPFGHVWEVAAELPSAD
jgi:PhnB protein